MATINFKNVNNAFSNLRYKAKYLVTQIGNIVTLLSLVAAFAVFVFGKGSPIAEMVSGAMTGATLFIHVVLVPALTYFVSNKAIDDLTGAETFVNTMIGEPAGEQNGADGDVVDVHLTDEEAQEATAQPEVEPTAQPVGTLA